MMTKTNLLNMTSWIVATAVIIVGVLNIALIHIVPGVVYLILSLVYLPPANNFLTRKAGFSIPIVIKGALGVAIFFFTLGVSDLGDMID